MEKEMLDILETNLEDILDYYPDKAGAKLRFDKIVKEITILVGDKTTAKRKQKPRHKDEDGFAFGKDVVKEDHEIGSNY